MPFHYYFDAVVTLDRPRHLIGNDSSAALFKAITGVDVRSFDFTENADFEGRLRAFTTLLFCMARETDPTVEAAAIANAVTLESIPRIITQIDASRRVGAN